MSHSTRLGLFLLSTATLVFEVNLTRLFSVAQFYHFAFMIVSMALLGFGASGTTLALFPALGRKRPQASLGWLALATGLSILGAYLLMNWLPFDSFSIAWDREQAGILVLNYLALAAPFFFSGMATGLLLSAEPQSAGKLYAANLTGAAVGCALALAAPVYLGGEGTVVLSSGLAALAAVISLPPLESKFWFRPLGIRLVPLVLLVFALYDFGLRAGGKPSFPWLELRISPYKSLSYALQYPGAQIAYQRWNAFSRVDVVRSAGIRSLPGLSYRYLQALPGEDGLLVDGDELSPILLEEADLAFCDYLPAAIAFHLRPDADTLVLDGRGGLDIRCALALEAKHVTAVEVNPLIIEAASHIYHRPDVSLVTESSRSFMRRTSARFEIVILSLSSSYHPVRSGAYSLAEDYRHTVEAFEDALGRLGADGLLVTTRWLQTPPSESLRTFSLAVTALENKGVPPEGRILAFRGYNTITLLVKNSPFTEDELGVIRSFTSQRAFDLVYAPDLLPEETNRFNILPTPIYAQAFAQLLNTVPRQDFYRDYPFDVTPPSDDHPFFGHYFKWSQASQVMAELGKTWQPFGGAGYFVVLALLALSTLLAGILILLPVGLVQRSHSGPQAGKPPGLRPGRYLLYFGLLGLAYLLVEIPLIQRFILYLGHPAYALTTVLFTLLLFSGLGSQFSERIPARLAMGLLVVLLLAAPSALPVVFDATLGFSLAARMALTALALAPYGLFMGVPFPSGIRWITSDQPPAYLVPWVWAVNGAASVISSILAALLALSFGFRWVFWSGALCYLAAWLVLMAAARPSPAARLRR